LAELASVLGAELTSIPASSIVTDILALREQLVILVSTGKAKEAVDMQVTHLQVKRLIDKKCYKVLQKVQDLCGCQHH